MALNMSNVSTSGEGSVLQVQKSPARPNASPAFGPELPGTGFESLPPLEISTELFRFLRCLGLKSVGLSLDCVPFHGGWELVEWKPAMTVSDQIEMKLPSLC